MMEKDTASQSLGMTIVSVAPGAASLSMPVTDQMLNGHGMCHGGFIFMLADSAFAFACNSYNRITVAQQNQITYLQPGAAGDHLTATATEVSRSGRSGVYDVEVTNQKNEKIAVFRGLSRTVKGQHYPEDGAPE
ncbi:hydroxyphenylacetyl-CoA thioesterase PaaI [uncultured Roseobacter sp.]|uniref:hydroxyphenylacetyl-CoA thioesterase PaaI n=1 Tax=uncultured Roseobacter sp. TaxID=114847 RepID=UPI002636833B|nr:hydroxyphenylacetyl-CoA thioesterase PaaI [uncultured Roseobacter sp.]